MLMQVWCQVPNTVFDAQQIAIPDPNETHTIMLNVASADWDYGFNEAELVVDPNDKLDECSEVDNIRTVTLKNAHPADLVVDGRIDELDLEILTSQWLQEPGSPSAGIRPWPADGIVNFPDFALLADNWLSGK